MKNQYVIAILAATVLAVTVLYVLQLNSYEQTEHEPVRVLPKPSAMPNTAQRLMPTPKWSEGYTEEQVLAKYAGLEQQVFSRGVNKTLQKHLENVRGIYMMPIKPFVLTPGLTLMLEDRSAEFAIASGCFTPDEGSARGIMALGYSLKYLARTRFPTVLLATEDCAASKELLATYWDVIVPVTQSFDRDSAHSYQKFKAYLLHPSFRRVIWMGPDTLALKNIDHLVFCEVPCAAIDMHILVHKRTPPVNGKTLRSGFSYYTHAAINQAFLVFEPSREQYDRFIAYMSTERLKKNYQRIANYWGAHDQAVLNEVVPHWTILPFHYSLEVELNNENTWRQFWDCCRNDIYTLHFASPIKPWMNNPAAELAPALTWQEVENEMLAVLPEGAMLEYEALQKSSSEKNSG